MNIQIQIDDFISTFAVYCFFILNYSGRIEVSSSSFARVTQVSKLMNMESVESVGVNVVDNASDDKLGCLISLVQEEGTWKFEDFIN